MWRPLPPQAYPAPLRKLVTPPGTESRKRTTKFLSSIRTLFPDLRPVKLTQPAATAQGIRAATSSSPPAITGGKQRREFPDDGSRTVTELVKTPASGLHSDQNAGLRDLIPAQVPVSSGPSVLAGQPCPPRSSRWKSRLRLDTAGRDKCGIQFHGISGNSRSPCQDQTGRFRLFIARFSATVASSIAHGDSGSQTVKSTGEASAKDGDSGHDEPDNSAAQASTSLSSTTKPSPRKDEADSATNAVEPNAGPATQLIPQSVNISVPVSGEPGVHRPTPSPHRPTQSPTVPEPVHGPPEAPNQTNSPARTISLQVEGVSGQTVDIRIAARPGDLNVAVRSGDAAIAQDLRQGLGDLESRLAQSGYHAETWHPGHGSTTEPSSPGGNSSNSSSQQQSQSGSGWSQQNRGQRDNNPSNRPRWVNQLASTLKAESTEKGNANGIIT